MQFATFFHKFELLFRMMIIRKATDADIPSIISLLKLSLGESFLPKSAGYWVWKHVSNPFGPSPVLLAEEGADLIGVRAFMRWQWGTLTQKVEAVRAVDTATHPEFQGKGVFSKLTTTLLKECQANQIKLVFNTPNKSSMPGYLKMGWIKGGILPIAFKTARPVSMIFNGIMRSKKSIDYLHTDDSVKRYLTHPSLPELLTLFKKNFYSDEFTTSASVAYLKWRYTEIPVARYYAAGTESTGRLTSLFIYRIKSTRWGLELRVTDLFYDSLQILEHTRDLLMQKLRTHQVEFVTFAHNRNNILLKGMLSFNSRSFGPQVTLRDINGDHSKDFADFAKWAPSLGDMELF